MPYSFTQIEKDKSRMITAAFCFLALLYFAAIWGIALLISNYSYFQGFFIDERVPFRHFGFVENTVIFAVALTTAIIHWLFTLSGLTERIIRIFKAQDPDPNDPPQKMFQNIIEEVRVATGGGPIRGMIIPTMALNACAFGDGETAPVIAVTKGALYKLNRNQLEGVVAHEAAHVVSEDYLGTTIVSSMFEIFGATLRAIRSFCEGLFVSEDSGSSWSSGYGRAGYGWGTGGGWSSRDDREGRGSGAGGAGQLLLRIGYLIFFVLIILIIMWIVNGFATLMRMFVSREREFRADATAVRLTRYPLGLAEALYVIAHHRHSLAAEGDSLETLFIVNPSFSFFDDGEGFFSTMFSTHPPVQKRVDTLLSMAHGSEEDLQKVLKELQLKEEAEAKERQKQYDVTNAPKGLWMAQNPGGAWLGPFQLQDLISFEWVTPQTMVKQVGQVSMISLSQLPFYPRLMVQTREKKQADMTRRCPACSGELQEVQYEGVPILKCSGCEGVLVGEEYLSVILHRKQQTFDERIQGMAQTLLQEPVVAGHQDLLFQESDRRYRCQQCLAQPKKWRKCFFNRYYHIEVDKCMACGLTWFDKDELDVMQCIFETRDAQERGKAVV